ncbi:MAG: hypothetical protein PHE09_02405 [Oscillospiraceae bacterium]|nr:hypothetical protein [Oscillospiraceae bacterium]
MIFKRNNDLKIKPLRYQRSNIILGKFLLSFLYISLFLISIYFIRNINIIKDIANLKVTNGDKPVTSEEAIDFLGTVGIPLFIFIYSTAITVIINFVVILTTKYSKDLLSDEVCESVKQLLHDMPIIKIDEISSDGIKIRIKTDKLYRLLSYCDNTSLVDYGTKNSEEQVHIDLKDICYAHNKMTLKTILYIANYYMFVLDISLEHLPNNMIKTNTLRINYYYLEIKELKRWCKLNKLTDPFAI